jgi:hypothetical protein
MGHVFLLFPRDRTVKVKRLHLKVRKYRVVDDIPGVAADDPADVYYLFAVQDLSIETNYA